MTIERSGTDVPRFRGWIDEERTIDRRLRFFSRLGWGTAILALLLFAGYRAYAVSFYLTRFEGGPLSAGAVYQIVDTLVPVVFALGGVGLLTGVLATLGSFMRFRTASLEEIQLRLAAIEEALLRNQV